MLRLLAEEAPLESFEELLLRAGQECTPADQLRLEKAVRLAYGIHNAQERRRQREEALADLVDTARDLTQLHDLGELLHIITRRVKRIINADLACFGLLNEDGSLSLHAAEGVTTALVPGTRMDGGPGHQALSMGAPLWTADYLRDTSVDHWPQADEFIRAEGIKSLLAVPLFHGDSTLGVLFCATRSVRRLSPVEIGLVCSLAALGAVAIERAERLQDARSEVSELELDGFRARTTLARLEQLGDAQSRMMGLLLSGADLDTVAQAAADALDSTLQLRDPAGRIIAATAELPDLDDAGIARTSWEAHARRAPVVHGEGTWVTPVLAGAENLGFVVLRPAQALVGEDQQMLRLVVQTFALQLLLQRGAAVTEAPVHDALFNALLALPSRGSQQARHLEQRLSAVGIDLTEPHVLLAVRPEGGGYGRAIVWASSHAHGHAGLKTVQDGCIMLLLPGTDASAVARFVGGELAAVLGHPVTVGAAGPGGDPGDVGRLRAEAVRCLEALTVLDATGSTASLGDLGFMGLLLSDAQDVGGFIGSAVGPVLDYDRKNATGLTETLEAYFATGSSPSKAAEALHVHPNTVSRRLERVTALLGPEWQRPDRALDIQLALRVHRMRAVLRLGSPVAEPL
ncbi:MULTISPECIES: helix-turn-helix domain-containing protein [unclassified Streptomyces]|uniref:helix-turn-helix domain-containing protein n=1 Tax=unclassified Streptomyces TaxID=2593676 RepID=UPI002237111C|nr:helix-turn-helix domain-containing protein [Streptomyces sp. SHP 1-2]MCW5253306.1 helix-turn-helix domain-containing protein [Streptomyces sp. SHP 1-2]